MKTLGIDIGGTSVKLAAVEHGQTLWTSQSSPYSRPDTHELIKSIREAAAGRIARADAVGLCVPGLMDKPTRTITLSVNVPGLNGVNLDSLVLSALGEGLGPVSIITDGLAAAHDIWVTRNLTGRLLVFALGTGIGACVLDDGKPLRVDGDSPGHFGQLDVSLDATPPIGPDGGAGSLEAYLGAAALAHHLGPDWSARSHTFTANEPPFRALARAIRIAHAIYRPHHIVLAGGIGIRLSPLLPHLRDLIESHLTNIARKGWTLTPASHDHHAALGAARLATPG